MPQSRPLRAARPHPALPARALDDLRFIRNTMERAGSFTAMPGWGGVGMGAVAIAAAPLAARQPTRDAWLLVWIGAAAVAVATGAVAVARKARRAGVPVLRGPGAKFALGLAPALVAAAALTPVLFANGLADRLPGAWLLLYGAAVVAGGAYSVRVVPIMGAAFMAAGAATLAVPAAWGDVAMAVGFGGLHAVFGLHIARHHGG